VFPAGAYSAVQIKKPCCNASWKAGRRSLADEVVVAAVAAATMTTEPVVTTRLALGDAVEIAVAGRRTAQTAAARRTTGVVVVVAWLIDGGALIVRAAQDRHQLLQLTCELVVIDVVSSSCVRLTLTSVSRLTAFRDSVIDDLFIQRSKPPRVQRWARSSSL